MELDGIEHDPVSVQNFDIYAVNPDLALAILRYKGAPEVEPTTLNVPGVKLLEGDMHVTYCICGPWKGGLDPVLNTFLIIEREFFLYVFCLLPRNTLISGSQPNPPFFDINGISYISPTLPVLLQLLSGAKDPQDLLPSEQVFLLPPNKLIEISVPGGGQHPFHLHGHAFDIVRTANSDVVNYVNPPRRDVGIAGGNVTFRFFSAGLAVVFDEAPQDNISGPKAQITPSDW
ncbi:hypothetical protein C0995_004947, partial [Termitomyces sp. Mi166